MQPIRIVATASLTNPNSPSEVTLIADAVGVGTTYRMASGHVITWTAEFLRANAHSFIGKPVNIDIDEDGEATGHSRRVVGAITHAFFDERKQVVTVHAACWPHYAPETISQIKKLAKADPENRTQVSMEFIPTAEMIANADGSESPTAGEFSGLGIVGVGADPRNQLILVAALAEDEAKGTMKFDKIDDIIDGLKERFVLQEKTTPEQERDARVADLQAAHEGAFEWYASQLAQWLAGRRTESEWVWASVIATYPKYAIYQEGEDYFKVPYTRKGRELEFGDPVEVDPTYNEVEASAAWQGLEPSASTDTDADLSQDKEPKLATEISAEQKASLRNELLAEVQPQLDELATVKAENETLKAAAADREATELKAATTTARLDELDKIIPAKDDEAREARRTQIADLEQPAYDALKAAMLTLAEVHGGINSDADTHADEPEVTAATAVDADADKLIQDMEAREAAAGTSKEK